MCRDFIRGSACEHKRVRAGRSERAVRPPGNSDPSVENGERKGNPDHHAVRGRVCKIAGEPLSPHGLSEESYVFQKWAGLMISATLSL